LLHSLETYKTDRQDYKVSIKVALTLQQAFSGLEWDPSFSSKRRSLYTKRGTM